MVKRSLVAFSLVALLGGTDVALAQDTPSKPAEARHHGMARLQERLGLSDEQANAVKAAFQKHREEQQQLVQQLRVARAELRRLALSGGDAAAIQTKTAEVQQLMGESEAVRVKVLQEIGPVLTPEQRTKFAQARLTHGHGKRFHRRAPAQS